MNFDERLDMCRRALRNEKTDKLPIMSNFVSAMALDTYGLKDCYYNHDLAFKAVCEFHERYHFDYYGDTLVTKPMKFAEALDANSYNIDMESGRINVLDRNYLEDDEWDDFINNYPKWFWEKAIPRKARAAYAPDVTDRIKNTFFECNDLFEYIGKISEHLATEYGIPGQSVGSYSPPIDDMLNHYRGIKKFSIDLRRNFSKLKAATDMLWETQVWPGAQATISSDEPNTFAVADFMLYSTSNAFLNPKQFEELFWHHVEPVYKLIAEKNKTLFLLIEADMYRFADCFRDIPAGFAAINSENDDVFTLRKIVPNLSIVGGIPCYLLGNRPAEENIEYVKKVIDEVGDRGLTLSCDKMVSFQNDYKRETLISVIDFIRDYRG